jgi:signal transduction histidine kinase
MPGAVDTSSRSLRFARPWSLRSILILLVVTAFAPLLVFAIAMVILSARSEREVFERGATERTRALITAVDAELKNSISTLEALATSDRLDGGYLRGFYDEAGRVLKSQPGWRNVIVSSPSGESLLNLLRPLDSNLEPVVELRSFDQVLKTLKPAVGDVLLGPLTGEYGFIMRVPVMRDGGIKYVLSAVISTRSIDAIISPQRLPENWIGVVLDFNKRFVTRTIDPERNVGRLASESLRAALDRSSEGWFRGTTVEGWDVYTPYSRSSFSGWSVALGIPADFVDATLRRSMLYLVLFGIGLLALSLLIAWIFSNRTAASITSLALIARDVVSGKSALAADSSASRIAEVEAVRNAFVTAHRLLREQSEEKERIALRLQLALSSGNIGVHEWHLRTNQIIWDERERAHWGLSPGTPVTAEIFRQGAHPEDRAKLRTALKRALDPSGGGQYYAQFRVIGIEDHIERWIEARGQVAFEGGTPVRLSGTTIDITQSKKFQAELERQVQERTVRLEETIGELEAFSYSVSHDMRAPLRAMEGYAQALVTDYQDRLDPQGKHWLDRINRSAHRLDSLIKDVLAYSKVAKEEIELSPVDLEGLIEDIIATNPEFQPLQARIVLERPLHRVLGHEAYLTQCITNLLNNAIKFARDGAAPVILIRSERLDGKVRLWFEDNGIGIDPAHYKRIFQIFGQVYPEERYGGTGIGLAIVRKAVQRMNGEVGVESEVNKGSRFWLILNGEKYDG